MSDELYELIKTRRSIRAYRDQDVPDELLDKILQGALWAASGKNYQNWHFYVLKGAKLKEFVQIYKESWEYVRPTLEKKLKPKLLQLTADFFGNIGYAPVVILVFSDKIPGEEEITTYGSVFLAVQNILLLAHKEGLGTCVLTRVEEKAQQVKALLGVADLEFLCGIAMGYYDQQPPAPPRKPDRIHWMN